MEIFEAFPCVALKCDFVLFRHSLRASMGFFHCKWITEVICGDLTQTGKQARMLLVILVEPTSTLCPVMWLKESLLFPTF